ncbi:uncharacterized protein LOC133532986 isoform X2 [Cydia pomonella]|nr:uncharacterized protein LOC133532986 isoform X2 [Cydia pomonella]
MPPTNTDSDDRVSLNTTTTDRLSLDTTTTDRLSLNTTTTDRLSLNTTTTDPLSLDTTPINCVSLDTTTNDCVSPDGLADIDEQALKSELQIDEVLEPSDEEPHSTAAVIDPLLLECSELRPVPSVPPSPPRVRASPAARRVASLPRFRKRAKPTETERERNQKLRQTKFDAIHCTREYDRILFETKLQHLEEKRREDRDIYELKKRKLELEISLLERQNKN